MVLEQCLRTLHPDLQRRGGGEMQEGRGEERSRKELGLAWVFQNLKPTFSHITPLTRALEVQQDQTKSIRATPPNSTQ